MSEIQNAINNLRQYGVTNVKSIKDEMLDYLPENLDNEDVTDEEFEHLLNN